MKGPTGQVYNFRGEKADRMARRLRQPKADPAERRRVMGLPEKPIGEGK